MSEFKRTPGVSDDPEQCYRAGFHHGAQELFRYVETKLSTTDQMRLVDWIQIELAKWRSDRDANPNPPTI
jgi:hypothetical protein